MCVCLCRRTLGETRKVGSAQKEEGEKKRTPPTHSLFSFPPLSFPKNPTYKTMAAATKQTGTVKWFNSVKGVRWWWGERGRGARARRARAQVFVLALSRAAADAGRKKKKGKKKEKMRPPRP